MDVQRAFTVRYQGRVRVIQTIVGIFPPLTQEEVEANAPAVVQAPAVWDTGATGSVITKKIADQLGLKPIGLKEVHHAAGSALMNEYLVNIALPNRVVVSAVRVTEGVLTGTEVLIGMDIIGRGDFAVTHCNPQGGTTMSFCMPSTEEIDFVPRAQADEINKTGNRAERRALKRKQS